jgi:uncharacterized repeat protein (TIGR02543 family)
MKLYTMLSVAVFLVVTLSVTLEAFSSSVSYTYDAKGRLTRADYGTDKSISYTYDAVGNIKSKNVSPYGTSNPAPLIIASGYVKDRFGSAIAGVTVNAYTLPVSPSTLVDSQTSAVNGSFSMSIPASTTVVLKFVSDNYRTAYSQNINLSPAATNLDVFTLMSTDDYAALNWTLTVGKTFLRGKVIDKQGAALSNVGITTTAPYTAQYMQTVAGMLSPAGQSGMTSTFGVFVIPGVSPTDTITLTASSSGKTFNSPVFSHIMADTDSLALVYDNTPVAPGGISGRLVNQYNLPFKDVMVRYYTAPSYAFPSFGAQSNANGEYTISNLSASSYKLEFVGGPTSGCSSTFFYNGKSDKTAANPVVVGTTPVPGINATLTCTSSTNTVTISTNPPAGGKVVSAQAINCPASSCSAPVPTGVSVPLAATPASGYQFANWTGTNGFVTTATNPLTVSNITSAMTITANFTAVAANSYPFALSFAGDGGGNVNDSGNNINCNSSDASCPGKNFSEGTLISLSAVPFANSRFSGWNGACMNITGNCNFAMGSSPSSVTATFSPDKIRIGGTYYPTILAAFGSATNGSIIQSRSMFFSDDIIFDKPGVSLKFVGGLETDFTAATGFTTIHSLKIKNGNVAVGRLKLK